MTMPYRSGLTSLRRAGAATSTLLVMACAVACGDDAGATADAAPASAIDAAVAPADADTRDVLDRLADLPGVSVVEEESRYDPTLRYFVLTVTQPVDHTQPAGPTFGQNVTVLVRDVAAPTVVGTTGYWNYYLDYPTELTQLLGGNQVFFEHRFFAQSRPEPADWSHLTIRQAADDQHRIITLLRPILGGPWLSTGASKGGMTATYHRRFYPDDVVASVPYVAPLSRAAPDLRYAPFLDGLGTPGCGDAVRALQVAMLGPRWAALLSRAQAQASSEGLVYQRVAVGPALESSITGLDWAFWQYQGEAWCSAVPGPGASDDAVWTFLDVVNPVSGSTDDNLAAFEAYYFQAAYELGYPGGTGTHLAGLTRFGDVDYAGAWPVGVTLPPYRAEVMVDIESWVDDAGTRLLFVYGEFDPWTAGRYPLGAATDASSLTVAAGTHGAGLVDLAAADKAIAYEQLGRWTGVTPDEGRLLQFVRRAPPRLPRLPPPLLRRPLTPR